MSKIFHNLKLTLNDELEEKLQWLVKDFSSYRILRQSVDARRRHEPHLVYSVEVFEPQETPPIQEFPVEKIKFTGTAPLIIGSGPAGLFAALRLVERGIPCHLFERGSRAEQRIRSISRFWRYNELDPQNNVCFGEGGAGLYSDGKLITRIKSEHIPYVMHRLVRFGAPAEIQYLANPHVGSDRIRRVIPKIREYLEQNGCQIHYDTQVTELLTRSNGNTKSVSGLKTKNGETFESNHIILATGHSANDIFEHLRALNVFMEGKSFAVGLRIEHPQKYINEVQYRQFAGHPKLGAANYKIAFHNESENYGVYSFCMCPGGYVLSSGTEADGIVVNGMSNYNRNSPYANAALVVTIDHEKSFGKDLWGGMNFRHALEKQAKDMVTQAGGTREIPAQRLTDFLERRLGPALPSSSPSGAVGARLDQLLPRDLYSKLTSGLEDFDRKLKGFISDQAQLYGVESRTSCPVRITRHEDTLQSLSHEGLYPTGEGAGYAGGITSAACDGIRAAEAIVKLYASVN